MISGTPDILIIGPGSLGCLMAAMLHREDPQAPSIALLDHSEKRAAILKKQGLLYTCREKEQIIPIAITADTRVVKDARCLLFCVKSHQLAATLQMVVPLISSDTVCVFMQNGIQHVDIALHSGLAQNQLIFATTTEGATLQGPGHVYHAGRGVTELGLLDGRNIPEDSSVQRLMQTINDAGMNVQWSQHILERMWHKLLINCSINGLTVLYNCTNGELLKKPEALSTMKKLFNEAMNVALSSGIMLTSSFSDIIQVCKNTSTNISSMLQDIRNKKTTEIDAINGALLERAKNSGIAAPANRKLVSHIKKIEKSYANSSSLNRF